jgi:Rps23 Pro-64 3,4-dihydroxylase Tpa1-like proline 4-hydroxylase
MMKERKIESSHVVRALPKSTLHTDWAKRDMSNLDFARELRDQFTWNAYIETPPSTQLVIYNHDERKEDRIDGAKKCNYEHAVFTPANCDLVIFMSTNAHQVIASETRTRIALGGFFGTTNTGTVLWV